MSGMPTDDGSFCHLIWQAVIAAIDPAVLAATIWQSISLHLYTTQLKGHRMAEPSENEIRKRAHELWEKAGRPEGRDKEFWELAEQELRNADPSSPLRTPDNL